MSKNPKRKATGVMNTEPEKPEEPSQFETVLREMQHCVEVFKRMLNENEALKEALEQAESDLKDLQEKADEEKSELNSEVKELEDQLAHQLQLPGISDIWYKEADNVGDEQLLEAFGKLLESGQVPQITDLLNRLTDKRFRTWVTDSISTYEILYL